MAYYFLFPEKDTTLYSHPDRKELNAGNDEILEIVKERGSSDNILYPSRVLIKFKTEDLKSAIETVGHETFNLGGDFLKTNLQLTSADPKNLIATLNLESYAVSESWDEGTGRYGNLPTSSNGASWVYRNNTITATKWTTDVDATYSTFASGAFIVSELPSSSAHQITINGIDFIPVLSSSIFTDSEHEIYVDISSSVEALANNFVTAINASQSLTLASASLSGGAGQLLLSSSTGDSTFEATGENHTVTTSSIEGNDQNVFTPVFTGTFNFGGGTSTTSAQFTAGTTGSISSSLITKGGGTWYTGSDFKAAQQFLVGESLDINFDVTSILKKWSSSFFASQTYPYGIENQGFIIKKPETIETNTSHSFGELQYFSLDTHTVYPPQLCFKWDDSTHEYQASASLNGNLKVSLYRNEEEYNQNDIATFRIHVRDKYPQRKFATTSNFLDAGWFTTSSYFSVRDAYTEKEIIPFDDNFTKLSADSEGMYFKVYMKGLQPERYYRILFKHKNNDGTTIYDNDYYFKVIR